MAYTFEERRQMERWERERRAHEEAVRYGYGDVVELIDGARVRVDDKSDDIKNGRPGGAGIQISPAREYDRWFYDDQVVRVVQRAPASALKDHLADLHRQIGRAHV